MCGTKTRQRSYYQVMGKSRGNFMFQPMLDELDALDRLDIRFRWGHYGIKVLKCHLDPFYAGCVIPAHKHREYEFHFIPCGKGTVTLDDGTYPLHAGMFYLTGPQVVHQQVVDRWDPMAELCLHVDIVRLPDTTVTAEESNWGEHCAYAEADECVRQLNMMVPHPTLDRYDAMSCFLTAYTAWRDRELGAYTTIQQAIIQIMTRAVRAHDATNIHTALPPRDMNAHRYQLATQYIRDNYARSLTLEQVAQELHVCGRQLQRIMLEQAEETFSGYLERYRLTQVCLALTHTNRTVEQLAVQHGFSSGSYLHYVFKKRLGITPLQYREQQRSARSVAAVASR
jgi:AraC-like DNA-binding protein